MLGNKSLPIILGEEWLTEAYQFEPGTLQLACRREGMDG